MTCPSCQYCFSFAQFCRITNPVKIDCPRCGAKLKIAGIRTILALVALTAIVYLVPATILSDMAAEPFNYTVLCLLALAFLFAAGYIVFRSCALEKVE